MENRHHFLVVDKLQHVHEVLLSLHRGSVQLYMLDKEGSRIDAAPTTVQVSIKRDARVVGARELQATKCGATNAVNDYIESIL